VGNDRGDLEGGRDQQPRDESLEPSPPLPRETEYAEQLDQFTDELERQARETLRAFRETAGELGMRVRQAIERSSVTWDESQAEWPTERVVHERLDERARTLARRWASIDFLVDPELPEGIHVLSLQEDAVWKASVRERGETRTLAESSESYTGQAVGQPGPIVPVWEYSFPTSPDIEAGERHERIAHSELIGACLRCNGTGHRACAACEGKGFVQCPTCHGRARIPCRRCRGRGRIADAAAERRARAHKGYFQVQAERLAVDAGERIADFAERLRQDYGVPLPPSAQWAPQAPASGETIPCPDCVNGTVPCDCGNGKRVCERCHGTGADTCPACEGSGRVLRFREVVRRFDTRLSERMIPTAAGHAPWVSEEMLRRASGDHVWEGSADALSTVPPQGIPEEVWASARALAGIGTAPAISAASDAAQSAPGERRVIARRLRLDRTPLTRVEYSFSGQPFEFVAVGHAGSERFWAQSFPPRWSRVSRFFKALARDLSGEHPLPEKHLPPRSNGVLSSLDEFRARRELHGPTGEEANGQPAGAAEPTGTLESTESDTSPSSAGPTSPSPAPADGELR
jgi:hypothetical protein